MTWLRLDDGFATHPKLASLSDRDFRAWVRLLCYLSRYDSQDGEVTAQAKREVVGITNRLLTKCEALRLLDRREKALLVHDWDKYRPKRDNTVTERVQRHRERQRNGVTDNGSNGVTPRVRVPDPTRPESESVNPPFLASLVGDESQIRGTPKDRLYALASNPEDRAKLERASKGLPESCVINALEVALAPGVRSQLGSALARLAAQRTGGRALPPTEVEATPEQPTVNRVALAEVFVRSVGAGYERRTMDEELTDRGVTGADHARLLALHDELTSVPA